MQDNTMQFHRGRLIDHVHLRVADVAASKRFYQALLQSLGRDIDGAAEGYFFADELFVDQADSTPSKVHLAFQAKDKAMVHQFYQAGLAAGGADNGGPGERHYHPGYYAAFLLDPDGNNIEAVYHGAMERSAPSVVITYPWSTIQLNEMVVRPSLDQTSDARKQVIVSYRPQSGEAVSANSTAITPPLFGTDKVGCCHVTA